MLKGNMSEKMMLQMQKKKKNTGSGNDNKKKKRLLIGINVVGSAGPIRFVVNADDVVNTVIDITLKSYAREGRLPHLGFDPNNFLLYCANAAGSEALSPWENIGSKEARNFVLCKKQLQPHMTEARSEMIAQKRSGWKGWLNNFKILSH